MAYSRDQLGHHSIRLTVDTYGHLVRGTNRAAVDRLDDALDATYTQPVGRVEESAMSEDNVQVTEKLARVYYRQG